MLYLRICFDKPGGKAREDVLKNHRQYVGRHLSADGEGKAAPIVVVQAGPMYAGTEPDHPVGSFLVVEAESIDDVRKFNDEDPFTQADLFERVDIVRWDRHIGNPDQAGYVP